MTKHRLDHIHIYCSDPDVTLRFFVDVFEAEVVNTARGPDGGVRHMLSLSSFALILAPYPEGTNPQLPAEYQDGIYKHGYGIGHFGMQVEDLYAAIDKVRQRGGTVLNEPRDSPSARFAYIGGPDGVIVELLEEI
jgi:lactoylglutathione lyase